jgi:glycosyltransferase involved in cell wall biosynthesis
MSEVIRVAQHMRRPRRTGNFSVERMYAAMRPCYSARCTVSAVTSPRESRGVLPRLENAAAARATVADVHHLTGDNGYLAFALPAHRTVLTVLDCIPDDVGKASTRAIVRALWITWPTQRVARVVAISEATREALVHYTRLPSSRIDVIPAVVPTFDAAPPRAIDGTLRVLQIGTAANKNIERLAEAMTGLDAELEVIGPLSASQQDAIARAGLVYQQRDRVSDDEIREAYVRSDVVAVVSTLEGFGMPVIEAQQVGRPVLAARASSLPDVAGRGACFVDPFDVRDIRTGLLRLHDDATYRATLVAEGTVNARRYSAATAAAAYEAIYREVARGR